jgi:hypothetical protein
LVVQVADRAALLKHLFTRVMGKALTVKQLDAIAMIFAILSTHHVPLSDRVTSHFLHVCGPQCRCGGGPRDTILTRLVASFRVLLLRQPSSPSEERWTTITPCLAYFAVFLFFNKLGSRALFGTFEKPKAFASSYVEVDSSVDWKVVYAQRLTKAMHLLGHDDTLCHCIMVGQKVYPKSWHRWPSGGVSFQIWEPRLGTQPNTADEMPVTTTAVSRWLINSDYHWHLVALIYHMNMTSPNVGWTRSHDLVYALQRCLG